MQHLLPQLWTNEFETILTMYLTDLFAQRQMYECQVSQSRNPRLNAYIADTVAAVKMEIGKVSSSLELCKQVRT